MSPTCRLIADVRRILLAPFLLALAGGMTLPVALAAQGGGMGGFGPPGGGMGGGHGHGLRMPNSNAPEVGKHFEEMASLKEALKHVDGLSGDEKKALSEIERQYGKAFKSMGHDAQALVDSAHAAHERPDHQRMDSLHKQATQLRDQEFAAAREILTADKQRDQFDQNVTLIRAEEAKRQEAMEEQFAPGGPDGPGGMPGGHGHP